MYIQDLFPTCIGKKYSILKPDTVESNIVLVINPSSH